MSAESAAAFWDTIPGMIVSGFAIVGFAVVLAGPIIYILIAFWAAILGADDLADKMMGDKPWSNEQTQ